MNSRGILSQGVRATIAVVALYGLLLQAFLTGFLPMGGAQTHGFAELCAPAQDSGAPAKHDKAGCCTAACISAAAPPPEQIATALSWPLRKAQGFAFREAAQPPARGPPLDDHPPRGPPTA